MKSVWAVSLLLATSIFGLDLKAAVACSGGSSGTGLSHSSKISGGSVSVCVGSSSSSSGSTTTQVVTKTVTVPVAPKPKAPAKQAPKVGSKQNSSPASKPTAPACPSASQLAAMPKSPDAAERWVMALCSPDTKSVAKPAPKPDPKPTSNTKTITLTELLVIETPGSFSAASDEVAFAPHPLVASFYPSQVLRVGQVATFSSNASSHFGTASVLGRQAEVHFVPQRTFWEFSDGRDLSGGYVERSFSSSGQYQAGATVEYLVSYRILGESTWSQVPGSLLVESNTLEIQVGATYLKADKSSQGALLVGQDCSRRPQAFGCDI